jgi:hypothetical protein
MKAMSMFLAVLVCCATLGGCAGSNTRYEEALAKGQVPFCEQSKNLFDPNCTVMRGR